MAGGVLRSGRRRCSCRSRRSRCTASTPGCRHAGGAGAAGRTSRLDLAAVAAALPRAAALALVCPGNPSGRPSARRSSARRPRRRRRAPGAAGRGLRPVLRPGLRPAAGRVPEPGAAPLAQQGPRRARTALRLRARRPGAWSAGWSRRARPTTSPPLPPRSARCSCARSSARPGRWPRGAWRRRQALQGGWPRRESTWRRPTPTSACSGWGVGAAPRCRRLDSRASWSGPRARRARLDPRQRDRPGDADAFVAALPPVVVRPAGHGRPAMNARPPRRAHHPGDRGSSSSCGTPAPSSATPIARAVPPARAARLLLGPRPGGGGARTCSRWATATTSPRTSPSPSVAPWTAGSATAPACARYGQRWLPMDDALALAAVDVGGRPFFAFYGAPSRRPRSAAWPASACPTSSLASPWRRASRCTCAVTGASTHHMAEACFKALGLALAEAMAPCGRGVLSHQGGAAMIGVVDLGCGNLRSLENALAALGLPSRRVAAAGRAWRALEPLILPGVGPLRARRGAPGRDRARTRRSHHGGRRRHAAARHLPGHAAAPRGLRRGARARRARPAAGRCAAPLGRARRQGPAHGLEPGRVGALGAPPAPAYFVHSYALPAVAAGPCRPTGWRLRVRPGASWRRFRAGTLAGCQFHPERSGRWGLAFLEEVLSWS